MAFAGSASTTTLTSEGAVLPAGTVIKAALNGGVAKFTNNLGASVECGESTVEGKTENEGSASETVKVPIEKLTLTKCNCKTSVLKGGTLEIHTIGTEVNRNGTLTISGAEVSTECRTVFGAVHCIWSTGSTDLGKLTGGSPTILIVDASVSRTRGSGALCGSSGTWTARYKVAAPSDLHVDEKVDLSLAAPTFHVGEERTLTATNAGTVEWTRMKEGVDVLSGGWEFHMGEHCSPRIRNPHEWCFRKIKCQKAGELTWTLKVESTRGVEAEKELSVTCDN